MPGIGSGSRGTCFSGGAGSGGTFSPLGTTQTSNAGTRGGAGSLGFSASGGLIPIGGYQLGGAGNPTAYNNVTDLSGVAPNENQGTGGVLLLFVEGSIIEPESVPPNTRYFTANGAPGLQATSAGNYIAYPFGGGSGGGVVVVVNGNAANFTSKVQANGGIVATNGPGGASDYRSGGDGAAVCYTFEQI